MKRYPIEPLLDLLGPIPRKHQRAQLCMSGDSFEAAHTEGLSEDQAERLAVKFERHPMELWPDWGVPCAVDVVWQISWSCPVCGQRLADAAVEAPEDGVRVSGTAVCRLGHEVRLTVTLEAA